MLFILVLVSLLAVVSCAEFQRNEFKKGYITYPKVEEREVIGNYTLPQLQAAPPCGTVMSSFNGIDAYSNGDNQGTGDSCADWSSTGLQFQCVEYTQRYFNALHGLAPVWPISFAYEMCSSYPDGITPVGGAQSGYGVVFNWPPYGHTAVVTNVRDGIIDVIEQNGSPSGTNSYYMSEVLCFLAPARR